MVELLFLKVYLFTLRWKRNTLRGGDSYWKEFISHIALGTSLKVGKNSRFYPERTKILTYFQMMRLNWILWWFFEFIMLGLNMLVNTWLLLHLYYHTYTITSITVKIYSYFNIFAFDPYHEKKGSYSLCKLGWFISDCAAAQSD